MNRGQIPSWHRLAPHRGPPGRRRRRHAGPALHLAPQRPPLSESPNLATSALMPPPPNESELQAIAVSLLRMESGTKQGFTYEAAASRSARQATGLGA